MNLYKIISTLVICGTILLGVYWLSHISFSVRNIEPQRVNETTVTNSIAVQGQGKVYAVPDTAILHFTISANKNTPAEAQALVDVSLKKFKKVMDDNAIPKKNIQTQDIMITPEYDYIRDSRKLEGYKASHSIKVIVRDIQNKNKDSVGKIINAVSQMGENIAIEGMQYDIWDKTPYYTQARKLAMKKADQKIDELVDLSGVAKDKPLAISENNRSSRPYNTITQNFSSEDSIENGGSDDYISLGTMEVIVDLDVVYGIK